MKLKNIIYGMMCVVTLGSCSDKMEYHEYNNCLLYTSPSPRDTR